MDFKDGRAFCYHLVTNKLDDIKRMQGSKYVQSDITDALLKINKLIQQKEKYFFVEPLVKFQRYKNYL